MTKRWIFWIYGAKRVDYNHPLRPLKKIYLKNHFRPQFTTHCFSRDNSTLRRISNGPIRRHHLLLGFKARYKKLWTSDSQPFFFTQPLHVREQSKEPPLISGKKWEFLKLLRTQLLLKYKFRFV